jgi:hypothetical protein
VLDGAGRDDNDGAEAKHYGWRRRAPEVNNRLIAALRLPRLSRKHHLLKQGCLLRSLLPSVKCFVGGRDFCDQLTPNNHVKRPALSIYFLKAAGHRAVSTGLLAVRFLDFEAK